MLLRLFFLFTFLFSFSSLQAHEEEGAKPAGGPSPEALVQQYQKIYEQCTKESEQFAQKKDDYETNFSTHFKECVEAQGFQIKEDADLQDFDSAHINGGALTIKSKEKTPKKEKKPPAEEKKEEGEKKEGDKPSDAPVEKTAEGDKKPNDTPKEGEPKKE